LTVVGVLLILIFGTTSPLVAALTIVVGLIGLVLSAFGDLHQKAGIQSVGVRVFRSTGRNQIFSGYFER
jgi:glucose uptake protein GlcU